MTWVLDGEPFCDCSVEMGGGVRKDLSKVDPSAGVLGGLKGNSVPGYRRCNDGGH